MIINTKEQLPWYLERLDDRQKNAALDIDGPAVIFAGAGAGKSAVLAARVAHLLDIGVLPESILCVTFTNKAAEEMRSRIESYTTHCNRDISSLRIGTYHSICAAILRQYGQSIGIDPGFKVCDDSQSLLMLRLSAKDADVDINSRSLKDMKLLMDQFKSQALDIDEWLNQLIVAGKHYPDDIERFCKVHGCYHNRLRSRNVLDFGDLTREVYRLLDSDIGVRRELSNALRYILVDEYQDTSDIESRILKYLSSCHGNLCVVGDLRQSIFSWRGSDYRLMMNFDKEYPGARIHVLETNYRSAKSIVEASEKLISSSPVLSSSGCYPSIAARNTEGRVDIIRSASDYDEAVLISRLINEIVASGQVRYCDIAILSRIRKVTNVLENILRKRGILYASVGSEDQLSLFPEVQSVLGYLKCIINPEDIESRNQVSDMNLFLDSNELSKDQALERFSLMHKCGVSLQSIVDSVVEYVFSSMGVVPRTDASKALTKLKWSAMNYNGPSSLMLQKFLDGIENEADIQNDAVQIMTIHQSKGLQFPVVFLIGLEEGNLPGWHSIGNPDAIEEERRLCYVAMTRAMEWLGLCCSKSRTQYIKTRQFPESRFLAGSSS